MCGQDKQNEACKQYEEYEPFYEQLLSKCPEICKEGELFQFSLPALNFSWDENNSESVYEFLDTLPAEQGILYVPGTGRLTALYADYLDSLNESAFPDIIELVQKSRNNMVLDGMVVQEAGKEIEVPEVKISKTNALFEKGTLSFTFSSESWKNTKEPVTVEGGADFSEWAELEQYDFTIVIEGLRLCEIERGSWYEKSLLSRDLPLIGGGMLRRAAFWGSQGAFSLIPQKILLVDRLCMKLNIRTLFPARMRGASSMLCSKAQESFYFLGIPVELVPLTVGFRAVMCRAGDVLRNCFKKDADSASILGVTSTRY